MAYPHSMDNHIQYNICTERCLISDHRSVCKVKVNNYLSCRGFLIWTVSTKYPLCGELQVKVMEVAALGVLISGDTRGSSKSRLVTRPITRHAAAAPTCYCGILLLYLEPPFGTSSKCKGHIFFCSKRHKYTVRLRGINKCQQPSVTFDKSEITQS